MEGKEWKYEKECSICGKTYKTNRSNSKVCSEECRREYKKEYIKKHQQGYREKYHKRNRDRIFNSYMEYLHEE